MRNPTQEVPVVRHYKSIVFNDRIVVRKKRHMNDYAIQQKKKKERMEIQINLCSHLSKLNVCNDFNRLMSTSIVYHKTFVRISFMVVQAVREIFRAKFFLILNIFRIYFFSLDTIHLLEPMSSSVKTEIYEIV